MKLYGLLVCLFVLFIVTPVVGISGEIFRYQDDSGAFYYTDDSFDIPDDKLPQVDTFAAVTGGDAKPEPPSGEPMIGSVAKDPPKAVQTETGVGIPDETAENVEEGMSAEQLNAEAIRLDQLHRELQAEKMELTGQSIQEMKRRDLNAYEQRVMDLNVRIEQHAREQAEFQQKIERYNARMKPKEETPSED